MRDDGERRGAIRNEAEVGIDVEGVGEAVYLCVVM